MTHDPRKDAKSRSDGLGYWIAKLEGAPPALDLPTAGLRRALDSTAAHRARADLTPEPGDQELLAGLFTLLLRLSGQPDLTVGVQREGQLLPLRLQVNPDQDLGELAQACEQAWAEAWEERADWEAILAASGKAEAPFRLILVLDESAPAQDAPWIVRRTRGALELVAQGSHFAATDTQRTLGQLTRLLESARSHRSTPISRLEWLTAEETRQILGQWNATEIDFPRDATLHSLFEGKAAEQPDAPAVVFEGRTLSYRELDERANRLAHGLIRSGVGPEVVVGLCVERSFEMVVGLMAIHKAGGAYLPMDPSYPRERLRLMVEDSHVGVLLTQDHLLPLLPRSTAKTFRLDADWNQFAQEPGTAPNAGAQATSLCYMIYTSGSTGKPKGVMLDHRGRVNNFLDFNRRFSVERSDALIALASLSFDMCAYDVFGTLAAGATIVLPRQDELLDPARWTAIMREHDVSIWHTAPAMLKMLVDYLEARPELAPSSLRLVLLGGDWIPVTLPDRLRALVDDVQVISMGGATECSMDSTIYEVLEVDPDWTSIPYGEPMKNQLAYVLDEHLQLLPVGVAGELYLGGIGVGRGYFERPELTRERFLENPFVADEDARMYRTGDLARWMPDGNLELLGRIDNQVKIRGHRIELGEIEALMRDHPAVREGVVAARDDASGEKRLVAYVVEREGAEQTVASELQSFLARELPDYMVPRIVLSLPSLPLSPNGKVDRKALPNPESHRGLSDARYVAPRNALEAVCSEIWSEVLGVESVGIEDSFLSLGGHSVLAVQIQCRVDEVLPFDTPLADVFEGRTVAGLCEKLRSRAQKNGIDAEQVARIVQEICQLSDEEVAEQITALSASGQ